MFDSKNMKKVVIWLTLIAIVCFGMGFLIFNITGGYEKALHSGSIFYSKDSKEYTLNDEKTGSINGVNEINAESACADINIIPEKRSDVKVRMYGNVSATYEPKLCLNVSGSSLEIKTDNEISGTFSIFKSSLKLDIYIPENYNESLSIKTSSGNISISKIKLKNLSGASVSGKLNFNDLTCDNMESKSTSGDMSGSNISVNSAEIKITSGSIDFSGFKGNLTGETISGKINIDYNDFNNNAELKSISGDIKLSLPAASQFKLQSKSVSGKISCKFPVTVDGSQERNELSGTAVSGKNTVIIKTTSGSITINKK